MNRIRTLLSTLGSLGPFALALGLISLFVIITSAAIGLVQQSTHVVKNELDLLNLLENEVSFHLLEMDIYADYYLISDGDPHNQDGYQESFTEITFILDDIEADGLYEEEISYYDAALAAIEAHTLAFTELTAAQEDGDQAAIDAAQIDLAEQTTLAQAAIEDWIYQIEARRDAAMIEQDRIVRIAVGLGALGLVALPLLAYWAFALAGGLTRPILELNDAVVSIQGGRLIPGALDAVVERSDNLGELAAEIESMAVGLEDRRQILADELQSLREQLREERRRMRI